MHVKRCMSRSFLALSGEIGFAISLPWSRLMQEPYGVYTLFQLSFTSKIACLYSLLLKSACMRCWHVATLSKGCFLVRVASYAGSVSRTLHHCSPFPRKNLLHLSHHELPIQTHKKLYSHRRRPQRLQHGISLAVIFATQAMPCVWNDGLRAPFSLRGKIPCTIRHKTSTTHPFHPSCCNAWIPSATFESPPIPACYILHT